MGKLHKVLFIDIWPYWS